MNTHKELTLQDVVYKLDELGNRMDKRFEAVDKRFDQMDVRIDHLEAHIDSEIEGLAGMVQRGFDEQTKIVRNRFAVVI